VDLIEELARLRGLEGVPGRLVTGLQPESAADRVHARLARLRRTLVARGWDECVTDALVEKSFAACASAVAVTNPLNESYTHLRLSLGSSLLQVAARNLARGVARLQLFELGKIYQKRERTTQEPVHLGLLVAGLAQETRWNQPERSADYFDMAGVLELLTRHAAVVEKDILFAGAVPVEEARVHGIKVPVYYAEVDLTAALGQSPSPETYLPASTYPSIRRDLAVVVPREMPQTRVAAVIESAQARYLAEIQLFDVFTDDSGVKIPREQKSLAYALTYRSREKTLTEREVNESHEGVRRTLVKELACTFRE
jgi:phenylalanyl-tRNA synthetase beta chain